MHKGQRVMVRNKYGTNPGTLLERAKYWNWCWVVRLDNGVVLLCNQYNSTPIEPEAEAVQLKLL